MNRIDNFRKKIEQASKIPYLISDLSDIFYLSGFTGSTAYIIVTDKKNLFVTDGRYEEQCKEELKGDWDVEIVTSYSEYFKYISERFQKLFVTDKLPLNIYMELSKDCEVVVDNFSEMTQLRMIKDTEEIELIKSSYRIAAEALLNSLDKFVFGKTEKEWAATLEYNMKILGAEKESFETIVASGYRGAMPHGRASNKIIDLTDPVIIDYGAKVSYVSDITRMVYLGSDKEILENIKIISDTVDFCVNLIMPGEVCSEIYNKSKIYLQRYGLDEYFNHGLGHSLGIDVHEKPSLSKFDNTIIQEGMVFTVEPGVYFSGRYGIRIEETVLVTKNGCEIISSMLKNRLLKF